MMSEQKSEAAVRAAALTNSYDIERIYRRPGRDVVADMFSPEEPPSYPFAAFLSTNSVFIHLPKCRRPLIPGQFLTG